MQLTVLSYDIFDSTIITGYFCQDDETLLLWAVAGNHLDIAKILLDAGANIQAKYGVGTRILMYAKLFIITIRLLVCECLCIFVCISSFYLLLYYIIPCHDLIELDSWCNFMLYVRVSEYHIV